MAYRIAVNHLLNVRKSEMEVRRMSFIDMGESLDGVPGEELPDQHPSRDWHGAVAVFLPV